MKEIGDDVPQSIAHTCIGIGLSLTDFAPPSTTQPQVALSTSVCLIRHPSVTWWTILWREGSTDQQYRGGGRLTYRQH